MSRRVLVEQSKTEKPLGKRNNHGAAAIEPHVNSFPRNHPSCATCVVHFSFAGNKIEWRNGESNHFLTAVDVSLKPATC